MTPPDWSDPSGRQLAREVVARLRRGRPLTDLGLGEHEGRIDLRGIPLPQPRVSTRHSATGLSVAELGDLVELRDLDLHDLDLSDAQLPSLRLFSCRLENCRLIGASCADWRLWATEIRNSSLSSANLRAASLGAWYRGKGNLYERVDFSRADLRSASAPAATFVDCDFSDATFRKTDLGGSSFIRCRFRGELFEVTFADRAFESEKTDPNRMEDVDFAEAELRWVEFRRLDLERVNLPESSSHVRIDEYRCTLERAIAALTEDPSPRAKALRAFLSASLESAGPQQRVGVFHRLDLAEIAGETRDGSYAIDVLLSAQRTCVKMRRAS